MRFSLGTLFLCALSGTVATLTPTSFKRDVKLSAEWGIHPDQLLSKTSMHAIADAQANISIKAEFVSVGVWLFFFFFFFLSVGERGCSSWAILLTLIAPNRSRQLFRGRVSESVLGQRGVLQARRSSLHL